MERDNDISYKRLKEMEERYRSIVERSPDGIGVMCDGKIVFANKRLADMHGCAVDELIGRKPFDLVAPEDRERAAGSVEAILSGGFLPSPREYKILKKSGEAFDVELTSSRIMYEGKPAIQTVMRDISERKKREKELKEMEGRYRGIVENSPDTIGIVCEGKLVFVNKKGFEIFGDVIGIDVKETVHPEDRERVATDIKAAISGEVLPPREYRLVTKKGEIIEAEITRSRIEYKGKPAIQSIIRDISERKNRERELRELEERYRSLVEDSPEVITIMHNGRLVFCNNKTVDMFGYDIDEIIGREAIEFIVQEDRERAGKNIKAILSGESLSLPREYKMIKKGGEIMDVEISSSRIEYKGSPAIQSTLRDISERKKRDNEIKKYIREMEILNNMAVDRELRMIELKKEINRLLDEMGREKKYKLEE